MPDVAMMPRVDARQRVWIDNGILRIWKRKKNILYFINMCLLQVEYTTRNMEHQQIVQQIQVFVYLWISIQRNVSLSTNEIEIIRNASIGKWNMQWDNLIEEK